MITSRLLGRYDTLVHGTTRRDIHAPCEGSMALHTGEDPAHIMANRRRFLESLGGCWDIVVPRQEHTHRIIHVTRPYTGGWQRMDDAPGPYDALVSPLCGVILAVVTADCVPILLYDPVHKVIAAVHAGWRGSRDHILIDTLEAMKQYGSCAQDIMAWIGPSIRGCCYEVGSDVADAFEEGEWKRAHPRGGKWMLDLARYNRRLLSDYGIADTHIETSRYCTSCCVRHFFSYRAQGGCSGRVMTYIGQK